MSQDISSYGADLVFLAYSCINTSTVNKHHESDFYTSCLSLFDTYQCSCFADDEPCFTWSPSKHLPTNLPAHIPDPEEQFEHSNSVLNQVIPCPDTSKDVSPTPTPDESYEELVFQIPGTFGTSVLHTTGHVAELSYHSSLDSTGLEQYMCRGAGSFNNSDRDRALSDMESIPAYESVSPEHAVNHELDEVFCDTPDTSSSSLSLATEDGSYSNYYDGSGDADYNDGSNDANPLLRHQLPADVTQSPATGKGLFCELAALLASCRPRHVKLRSKRKRLAARSPLPIATSTPTKVRCQRTDVELPRYFDQLEFVERETAVWGTIFLETYIPGHVIAQMDMLYHKWTHLANFT